MIDSFNRKIVNYVGVRTYTGPFTFPDFESHLFGELSKVQASKTYTLPNLKPCQNTRISRLKKRSQSSHRCPASNPADCTSLASSCSHTRNAYTNRSVPRVVRGNDRRLILPKIDTRLVRTRNQTTSSEADMLEVRHGNTTQFIRKIFGISSV